MDIFLELFFLDIFFHFYYSKKICEVKISRKKIQKKTSRYSSGYLNMNAAKTFNGKAFFFMIFGTFVVFFITTHRFCILGLWKWSFFHQVRNSLTFWHIVDRVMAFVKALFDLFIKAKGHISLLLE